MQDNCKLKERFKTTIIIDKSDTSDETLRSHEEVKQTRSIWPLPKTHPQNQDPLKSSNFYEDNCQSGHKSIVR